MNMILIGLNKGAAAHSYMVGKAYNPNIHTSDDMHYMALSIILIIVVVIVAFIYLLTGRKNKAGLTGIQVLMGKGDQKKPTKAEEQIRAINESINDSLVESLDDSFEDEETIIKGRKSSKVSRSMSM